MLETQLAMLITEDDVTAVAAAVEPGSSAAVLVRENPPRSRWWPTASIAAPTDATIVATTAETGATDTPGSSVPVAG